LPKLTADDLEDLGVATVGHLKDIAALSLEIASSRLARSVHSALAASEPHAERQQLTVMCCDLVGSTARSARLDPRTCAW
jgi:class 3 adenylate cyclase